MKRFRVQRLQREEGKSFVSRTTLYKGEKSSTGTVVFRCVLMNPLTTIEILREILDEQTRIFNKEFQHE